jgi:peptidyl-prolyl cis-trans isomerase SurA
MKRFWQSVFLAVTTVGAAYGAASDQVVNGVMVIVNQDVITRKDVVQYIGRSVELLRDRYRNQPAEFNARFNDLLKEGLEQLIEKKLILQEFHTAGYNLPESLIEDRVKSRIRETYGNDSVALTKSLAGRGMTREAFRREIREDFIVSAMRVMKVSSQKVFVSPYKIEKYYADHMEKYKVGDEYKLRIIMINHANKSSPDAARRLSEEIVAKLNEGSSFAEMAMVYSEDTFRAKGGDRGWIELEKEKYHQPLEQAIRSLGPGQRSGVIEAGDASWIALVEEVRPSRYRPLSEVRGDIEKALGDEEYKRLYDSWMARLKSKAFIRYF